MFDLIMQRDWRLSQNGLDFPIYTEAELRADSIVHLIGLGLAAAAIGWLVHNVAPHESLKQVIAVSLYCFGLVSMLSASAAYNMLRPSHLKLVLRRLDHSMIFLMIAGTYTPFIMSGLPPELGKRMFGVIWGCAAIGIGMKLVCGDRYRLVFLALYLGMGWLGLAILPPLLAVLPKVDLLLLLIGGLIYSLGAIVHARARMPFHNAAWHAMVLVAAAVHFAAVARLVAA